MRLFIAVEIPGDAAFNKLFIGLRPISKYLRPVDPNKQHITLKFLGDVGTSVEDVIDSISGIGQHHKPIKMRVKEAGAFPNWKRPSVLWLGLSPVDDLRALAMELDRNLHERVGTDLEKRDFRAHITVARYKGREPFDTRSSQDLVERTLKELEVKNYEVPVNEFHLISSILTPKGPVYRNLASFPLSG